MKLNAAAKVAANTSADTNYNQSQDHQESKHHGNFCIAVI